MIDDDAQTAAAGRPLGAISTLVSLFLLMLVFFIVLFSIAQVHRQRVAEVVSSIDLAFGGLPSRLGLAPPGAVPVPEPSSPEGFARAVSALITGFVPQSVPAQANPDGALLEIDLPPERLFAAGGTALTGRAEDIATRLAVLMQRRPDATRHYRLSLRLDAPQSGDEALASARAATLAAALYAAGCPADALAIGLERGRAALLRLGFAVVGPPPGTE